MATAAKVVERILNIIIVQASEQPVLSPDFEATIDTMNDLLTEWGAVGINLGYTIVSGPSDEITVPDASLGAIKSNVAMRLGVEYDFLLTPAMAEYAATSFQNLLNQTITVGDASFPDTLPIGAGNECLGTQRFFPTPEDELLAEDGGSIILESDL